MSLVVVASTTQPRVSDSLRFFAAAGTDGAVITASRQKRLAASSATTTPKASAAPKMVSRTPLQYRRCSRCHKAETK
jgi:hypothetical protein